MALPVLKLPRLQARMPVSDSKGQPTTTFVRYWNNEILGAIEGFAADIVAVQAELAAQQAEIIAVQQTQQDEIDRLNRVLAGQENFTGLLVNNQDVAPFLGTTDGSQIVDAAGLGPEIVNTGTVIPGAISQGYSAFSEATIAWAGTGETVAQTLNVTTQGGVVDVSVGISLDASASVVIAGLVSIYRDSTVLWGPYAVAFSAPTTAFTSQVLLSTISVQIVDQPAAGAHTYELKFSYDSTGGPRNARNRSIVVREQKTDI